MNVATWKFVVIWDFTAIWDIDGCGEQKSNEGFELRRVMFFVKTWGN